MSKAKNPNIKHYELWEGVEALDVIKTVLTREEYIGALKFNILKYQLRLGKKDDVEKEVEKIKDYRRELDALLCEDSGACKVIRMKYEEFLNEPSEI